MQALTYHGRKDVRVETVPDPVLAAEDDLILRVTATAICGSDLHLYRGKIPDLHDGDVLGHEFMGVVEEVGSGVTQVQPGDRVVIPFVIACGEYFHCRLAEYAACETTNTGKGAALNQKGMLPPAALFGYSHLYGGVAGGQAEFVRVPKANGTQQLGWALPWRRAAPAEPGGGPAPGLTIPWQSMRGRLHADVSHDAPHCLLQLTDVEGFGHEGGAAVTLRHQLVIDRGYEQERDAEFGQAISHREDHAVAKLDIEHGAVEPLVVQQPQRIEHAVGMGHLVTCVLQRLFHQRSQVELVFHQQQVASALAHSGLHAFTPVLSWELQSVLCCINAMRVHCQAGAKPREHVANRVEGVWKAPWISLTASWHALWILPPSPASEILSCRYPEPILPLQASCVSSACRSTAAVPPSSWSWTARLNGPG